MRGGDANSAPFDAASPISISTRPRRSERPATTREAFVWQVGTGSRRTPRPAPFLGASDGELRIDRPTKEIRLNHVTGHQGFPFPDLGFIATIGALLVALLILTPQRRHEEELAESRAQLTLHIAMLSERKIAKVIELLEEQRRDNPLLPSRIDDEATEMAQPADHKTTLGLIDEVVDQRREPTEE